MPSGDGVNIYSETVDLVAAGFSVIRLLEGQKRPDGLWGEFKDKRRASVDELRSFFPENPEVPHGYGVICGEISGNLIVLDFEKKTAYTAWRRLVEAEGLPVDELPVVESPGGFHVYCRLPEPVPGSRMAFYMRDAYEDKDGAHEAAPALLVESRGHGHMVVGPGTSKNNHPLKVSGWVHRWGAPVSETPIISMEDWAGLVRCVKALSEVAMVGTGQARSVDGLAKISKSDQRPGTDYCRKGSRADFLELMVKNGWENIREDHDGRIILKRPGKDGPGGSATLGAVSTSLGEALYVFSSNAAPFEPDTCYSIFSARALLEFGGDYGRASGACRAEGFGKPAPADLVEEVQAAIDHWGDEAEFKKLKELAEGYAALDAVGFGKTWRMRRKKDFGDDKNRYLRSVMFYCCKDREDADESGLRLGVGLCMLWRDLRGFRPADGRNADLVAIMGSDVLEYLDKDESQAQEAMVMDEAGDDRASKLKWLSAKLGGIPVAGIRQFRIESSEALFYLILEGGESVCLGDAKSWETALGLERTLRYWVSPENGSRVPGFSGLLPDSLSARVQWRAAYRIMFNLLEADGANETLKVAIFDWCYQYAGVSGCWRPSEEHSGDRWSTAATAGEGFCRDGFFCLSLDGLYRWSKIQKSDDISRQKLSALLSDAGFENKHIRVPPVKGSPDGTPPTSLRFWRLALPVFLAKASRFGFDPKNDGAWGSPES